MGWSAPGWFKLVLAGAIGASWILLGATAFAQPQSPADAEMPAMTKAPGELSDARPAGNDQ